LGEGFLFRQPANAEAETSSNPALSMAPFLPLELRRSKILAVQADDHYLRVSTDRGATLIHMAISEAERLLASEDGLRIHRSWWVSRASIEGVERHAGRVLLRLKDGSLAPVARARVNAVDGWMNSS
jgi:DNA-binding LytR/AlgR family response regulator